jgi:hypothetical protein
MIEADPALRAVCVLCAAVCSCVAEPPPESHANGITNGTPDQGDPAVVALLAAGVPTCTGTLIAPRVVLTAGHCIGAVDTALFGSSVEPGAATIDLIDSYVPAAFDRQTLRNDIAVVLLAEPAPAEVGIVPMLVEPPPGGLLGLPIRLVGFGSTGEGAAGIKREGETVISEEEETRFTFLPAPSQTCVGDSGGPAFLELGGIEYLAGVTSSGDAACEDHGTDTRVDVFAEAFVAPYVAATSPGAAASGERCYYDDNCASGECRFPDDAPSIGYCAPPCAGAADCPAEMACLSGVCAYDSPSPGALGEPCMAGHDCDSGLCVATADAPGETMCAVPCLPGFLDCPDGWSCLPRAEAAGGDACFLAPAGGCRAGAGRSDGHAWPWMLGLIVWLRRRRR